MTGFLLGVRLLFAGVFVFTALAKLADLARFELVLVQLFGTRPFARVTSRAAALLVAAYELGLAAAVGTGAVEPAGTVLLALTMAVFAAVVFRAWRLHVDCGCFRDRRPSEVASLARSAVLLGLAGTLAVAGSPDVTGPRSVLIGLGWALGLAAAVHGLVLAVRHAVRRAYPDPSPPRVVPAVVADQILAAAGRPPTPPGLADEDGWVELTALCRATRLPVSTLLRELERRSRLAGAPLVPTGTQLPEVGPVMAAPYLVVLFSATCTRCPKHVPEVVERLRADRPGRDQVLVVVAGTADGPGDPGLFTGAFAELATVVLEEPDGPVQSAFGIREFPAFYVVGADRTVLAAAHQIGDLTEVPV